MTSALFSCQSLNYKLNDLNREQAGRKISFENSAATFALKLSKSSGTVADVKKKEEAFISNVPISEDTPMLVDGR